MTACATESAANGTRAPLPPGPGWLLGGIWVVFLIYPLLACWQAEVAVPWRIVAMAITIGFGVAYIGAMRWISHGQTGPQLRPAIRLWLMLCALALATVPTIGLATIGFTPFLAAFAMIALPRPAALSIFGALIVISFVAPLMRGVLSDWWYMPAIIALVGVTSGVSRLVGERAAENDIVRGQLAVVAERERVARDVHDVLGHSLTVVSVKAELAERLIDRDPERARAELRDIQSLTREALAEIRATVGGLRVARLGDELAAADTALRSAGLRCDVPDDPEVVDPRFRIIFAWVLREAVTNVVRHARATACQVRLESDSITVSDDGCGLSSSGAGHGLRGIRERVESAGGTLALAANPAGRGTTLRVEM